MQELPRAARGTRRRYFEADGVDELLSMVLELTAEVSGIRQRLYVAERVLEKNGLDVGREIENYALTASDEEVLASDRERLLRTVTRTLDVDSATTDVAAADRKKTKRENSARHRAA